MWQQINRPPTAAEVEIIAQQLGRAPKGLAKITAITNSGRPLAVQVSPLVEGKPFPTFYWLSCPQLVKEIAHLEAAGVIKQLEDRLKEDAELLAAYKLSHENYIKERWQAMSAATKQQVEALGFTELFNTRGVGGIANWQQVRCLHTQYAHHLSSSNAIGQLLDADFSLASFLT